MVVRVMPGAPLPSAAVGVCGPSADVWPGVTNRGLWALPGRREPPMSTAVLTPPEEVRALPPRPGCAPVEKPVLAPPLLPRPAAVDPVAFRTVVPQAVRGSA